MVSHRRFARTCFSLDVCVTVWFRTFVCFTGLYTRLNYVELPTKKIQPRGCRYLYMESRYSSQMIHTGTGTLRKMTGPPKCRGPWIRGIYLRYQDHRTTGGGPSRLTKRASLAEEPRPQRPDAQALEAAVGTKRRGEGSRGREEAAGVVLKSF